MKSNPWTSPFGILLIVVMIGSAIVGLVVGSGMQEASEPAPVEAATTNSNSNDGFPDQAPEVYEEPSATAPDESSAPVEQQEPETEPTQIEEPVEGDQAENPVGQ